MFWNDCNWWRSWRDVLISWRLPGALSHQICTLHVAAALLPLLLQPPLPSAERHLPPHVRVHDPRRCPHHRPPDLDPCLALPPLSASVSPSLECWWQVPSRNINHLHQPPPASIGSVATFSCLNVYELVCVQLRTPGSARIRAPSQVHLGLCPALPPHQCFRVSKSTLMEMSGTTHSIDPSPPILLVSVSFHWKGAPELRSSGATSFRRRRSEPNEGNDDGDSVL